MLTIMGALLGLIVIPTAAYAYIDPGTGSVLIQGIIAAIAAVGVTLKLYWHRLVGLFRTRATHADDREKSTSEAETNAEEGQ